MKTSALRIPGLFVFFSMIMAIGCSSGPRARSGDTDSAGSSQNQEQYGPPTTAEGAAPISYGPEPVQRKPVTLVLGPGMARGFAHVGVLRAFAENKIPIRAIYGMEIGSLMAALYATDSNINHFEWSVLRFNDDVFLSDRGLLGKFFAKHESFKGDPDQFEERLKKVFGKRDISQARLPLSVSVQKIQAARPELVEKGALISVLRSSVAGPGFFGPGIWQGQPAEASTGADGVAFLCSEARARYGAPVVFIDTGVTASDPSSADLVIRPDLQKMAPSDFARKTDAAFRGKRAIEEHLPELKHWVGLPNTYKEGVAK